MRYKKRKERANQNNLASTSACGGGSVFPQRPVLALPHPPPTDSSPKGELLRQSQAIPNNFVPTGWLPCLALLPSFLTQFDTPSTHNSSPFVLANVILPRLSSLFSCPLLPPGLSPPQDFTHLFHYLYSWEEY